MSIQTAMGKSFEYACLRSMQTYLADQKIVIIKTNSLNVAEGFYRDASNEVRRRMDLAANAAVRVILLSK